MRLTSSIAFYCRASKSDKHGYAPIEMSININGNRTFINLPRKELPAVFTKSMGRKTTNNITLFCSEYRKKANDVINDLLVAGKPITSSTIKDGLIHGVMTSTTISMLWDEYLKLLKKRVGVDLTNNVYVKYKNVCGMVIGTIGDIDIKSISVSMAKQISSSLYSNYKDSTAAGYLTKIKTVFRYAFDCGYISTNPFAQVKVKKGEPDTTFLTKAELKLIEDRVFDIERLEKVRKLFLLECYTGMSYCDIQAMDTNKIQYIDGSYVYIGRRQKTKIQYTSVFFPQAMDIIRAGVPKISNQKLNSYLKDIQIICGIKKNLHSHLARHTYASLLICSGVNMSTISHLMGHSSPTITSRIYAIPDNKALIKDAMKAFK